ncbi:hypothetical protein PIB30_080136 [Stylosanthes scabra]|uniref:Uncharacterized protein n=1 Tax=Stylosanthes scabra TaxID=79078 RepID=A0ABU6ZPZ3_9FABA|nr:hypothetical protein [Stylosanthes scabra]
MLVPADFSPCFSTGIQNIRNRAHALFFPSFIRNRAHIRPQNQIEGTLIESPYPNLQILAVAILRRASVRTSEAPPLSSPSPAAVEKGDLNTTKTHIWVTAQLTPPLPSGFPGAAAETPCTHCLQPPSEYSDLEGSNHRRTSWQARLSALSLLRTLCVTSTIAHRSRHKAQFSPGSTPLNVSSLLRCSTTIADCNSKCGFCKIKQIEQGGAVAVDLV